MGGFNPRPIKFTWYHGILVCCSLDYPPSPASWILGKRSIQRISKDSWAPRNLKQIRRDSEIWMVAEVNLGKVYVYITPIIKKIIMEISKRS